MTLSPAVMAALDACYDAAADPPRWPVALQLLAESLGADSATFGTWDGERDPFRMPRSEGHEAFAERWLSSGGEALDLHISRGRRLARDGPRFILEQQVSTDEERRRHPYFGEIAGPGNRQWWAAICFRVGTRHWSLPLYRGAAKGPFTLVEARSAASAVPHLARIIRLAEHVAAATMDAELDLLDRLRSAALLMDERGRPLRHNRAAEALLAADPPLRLPPLSGSPGMIRPDAGPPLLLDAFPAPSRAFAPGHSIVTLTPVAPPEGAEFPGLSRAFGLTPAEARLAGHIAAGQGIGNAALALGIGVETARSQLKAVFSKTGTHRQAELAALVARFRR